MNKKTSIIALIALFTAILAVCAWICIPIIIPFTLQTFAVFLISILLGGKYGTATLVVYMLLGIVGVPVFSGFNGGPGVLLGPTGGYIIGFVFTVIIFNIITKLLGSKFYSYLLGGIAGLAVLYTFGTIWYVTVYSSSKEPVSFISALIMCVIPYIIPDLAKLLLAIFVSNVVKKYIPAELYKTIK